MIGRPPATPKPLADADITGGNGLGSGRTASSRHGGGGSAELHSTAQEAGVANAVASATAFGSSVISVSGAAPATADSSESSGGGAGLVLWSAGSLARGGEGGGGGGGGGGSKSFKPVGAGSSLSSKRLVAPQDGKGRQVTTITIPPFVFRCAWDIVQHPKFLFFWRVSLTCPHCPTTECFEACDAARAANGRLFLTAVSRPRKRSLARPPTAFAVALAAPWVLQLALPRSRATLHHPCPVRPCSSIPFFPLPRAIVALSSPPRTHSNVPPSSLIIRPRHFFVFVVRQEPAADRKNGGAARARGAGFRHAGQGYFRVCLG